MSQNTCQTCTHWDRSSVNTTRGTCLMAIDLSCRLSTEEEETEFERRGLGSFDAECYSSTVCTHATFGCNRWAVRS